MIARTLARRIVLRPIDRAVFDGFRYLECDPEIDETQANDHVLTVEPSAPDPAALELKARFAQLRAAS